MDIIDYVGDPKNVQRNLFCYKICEWSNLRWSNKKSKKSSSQNLLKQHQGQQVKKGWNRLQNQPVEHVKWDE